MLNFTMQISWSPERTGEMQCQRLAESSTTQKTVHAALWAIPGYQQLPITSVAARVANVVQQSVWITRVNGLLLSSDLVKPVDRQWQSKRACFQIVTSRLLMGKNRRAYSKSVTQNRYGFLQQWFFVAMFGGEIPLRHCERAFDRALPLEWLKIIRGFAYYLDAAGRLAGRKRASDVSWGTLSISLARFRRERRTSERQGGDATLELSLLGFSLNDQVIGGVA